MMEWVILFSLGGMLGFALGGYFGKAVIIANADQIYRIAYHGRIYKVITDVQYDMLFDLLYPTSDETKHFSPNDPPPNRLLGCEHATIAECDCVQKDHTPSEDPEGGEG